jgi:hypothetical protein
MPSVLADANATIQCTSKTKSLQQTAKLFLKNGPLPKFGVLPS